MKIVHTLRMTIESLTNLSATEGNSALACSLEADLVERYGVMLGAEELAQVLAYPSTTAFRRAAQRGHLPVAVFSIQHRKGQFALAKDVAIWLANARPARPQTDSTEVAMNTS